MDVFFLCLYGFGSLYLDQHHYCYFGGEIHGHQNQIGEFELEWISKRMENSQKHDFENKTQKTSFNFFSCKFFVFFDSLQKLPKLKIQCQIIWVLKHKRTSYVSVFLNLLNLAAYFFIFHRQSHSSEAAICIFSISILKNSYF